MYDLSCLLSVYKKTFMEYIDQDNRSNNFRYKKGGEDPLF